MRTGGKTAPSGGSATNFNRRTTATARRPMTGRDCTRPPRPRPDRLLPLSNRTTDYFTQGSDVCHRQTAASDECGGASGQWQEEVLTQLLHVDLHWLDVPERAKYKLCMMMHLLVLFKRQPLCPAYMMMMMPGRHCSKVSDGTLGTSL